MILRADSGICREELMGWCGQNHVDYIFGPVRNQRLRRIIRKQMHGAQLEHGSTRKVGQPASRQFLENRLS